MNIDYFAVPGIVFDIRQINIEEIPLKNRKSETHRRIEDMVCNHMKVSRNEIKIRTRKREIVEARQVCMDLMKSSNAFESLAEIGELMGGFDHATVLHSAKTVKNLRETNKIFREKTNLFY